MTSIQEHYTEAVRQTQEAAQAAVDTWTRTVQEAFGQFPTVAVPTHPNQVIDQVFDFAEKLLSAQREFAKNLVHTSTAVAQNIRQTAERAAESGLG
jgi:hypothetical protein